VGACIVLGLIVLAGALADLVAPYSPTAVGAAQMFAPPSAGHLLGTDRFGRDVLSRIVHGVRVSLGIAGASILVAGSAIFGTSDPEEATRALRAASSTAAGSRT